MIKRIAGLLGIIVFILLLLLFVDSCVYTVILVKDNVMTAIDYLLAFGQLFALLCLFAAVAGD